MRSLNPEMCLVARCVTLISLMLEDDIGTNVGTGVYTVEMVVWWRCKNLLAGVGWPQGPLKWSWTAMATRIPIGWQRRSLLAKWTILIMVALVATMEIPIRVESSSVGQSVVGRATAALLARCLLAIWAPLGDLPATIEVACSGMLNILTLDFGLH